MLAGILYQQRMVVLFEVLLSAVAVDDDSFICCRQRIFDEGREGKLDFSKQIKKKEMHGEEFFHLYFLSSIRILPELLLCSHRILVLYFDRIKFLFDSSSRSFETESEITNSSRIKSNISGSQQIYIQQEGKNR